MYMRPANERRRYIVTSSLIGWAYIQNDSYWVVRKTNIRQKAVGEEPTSEIPPNRRHLDLDPTVSMSNERRLGIFVINFTNTTVSNQCLIDNDPVAFAINFDEKLFDLWRLVSGFICHWLFNEKLVYS